MRIEELQLVAYKGFSGFTLKCSSYTVLTGLNSSGKTSILQAIQLVFDIFMYAFGRYADRNSQTPNFGNPQWSSDPSYGINRMSFGDPDALWLNKKTSEPCKLFLKVSGGIDLKLEIRGRNQYQLEMLVNGVNIQNSLETPISRKLVEELYGVNPIYVAPVAGISPAEDLLHHPQLMQKLDRGAIAESWRSSLYWLYNDGNKDDFDRVVEMVQRYLPGAMIEPPRLNHNNSPQVLINFEQDETSFDISTSGGGMRTILGLAILLKLSKSKCLLLDEPDAHLHSSLQREVARMLLDHAIENDVQIIASTHASDFIAEVPIESLVWIDRTKNEGRLCEGLGRFLADLGAVTKADAIRAYRADKILFIEGVLDRNVLAQLFDFYQGQHAPNPFNPFRDNSTVVAALPNGKGDTAHLMAFPKLLLETFKLNVKIACIFDNDYDSDKLTGVSSPEYTDVLLLSLQRKEIENYFIEPSVIAKAIADVIDRRKIWAGKTANQPSVEEVQNELTRILNEPEIRDTVKHQKVPKYRESLDTKFDPSTRERLGEEWFAKVWNEEEWRLENLPGKKVLAKLRGWAQANYSVSLTNRHLIGALQHCPTDLNDLFEKLYSYFAGTGES